ETARCARGETTVISGGNVHGNYSLPDSIEVDANVDGARRGRSRLRRRLLNRCRPWRRFIASLRQERRGFTCAKHREIDCSPHRTIDRTDLQPSGAWTVIRAGEEVEVFAARVESRRD